jgi:uncharacterized damage-inducible protein DinB
MSECARLADQIRRAFDGEAWHGDALVEVLANVSAKQAAARPIKNAHNIWEIVLHIGAWDGAVLRRPTRKIFPQSQTRAKRHGKRRSHTSGKCMPTW